MRSMHLTVNSRVRPSRREGAVPVLWLALLSSPIAAANNAPVLIMGDIARSLGVTAVVGGLLVTAFAWALAAATPLMATLQRRRGTSTVLWWSAALIVGGSIVVLAAPWLPAILVGRVAQAAGGAGMMTLAMSLAGSARRMGVIGAGAGIIGAAGPLLGRVVSDAASWRVALVLSVVVLIAVPAVSRYTSRAAAEGPFDARGAIFLTALTSGIVTVPIAPLAGAGIILTALVPLVFHIRRRPGGFIPLSVLRVKIFQSSVAVALVLSVSYFTLLFAVPQLIRHRAGWSADAVATGQLVALVLGSILTMALAAGAAKIGRKGIRWILLSLGAAAAATALFADAGPALLIAAGLAVMCATAGNATQSMEAIAAVPTDERASAVGLFSLSYLLGGAVGPALATLMVMS
ncbi:MFS transporter [Paenarthrobacter sp. NPDC089714]|uniref:MFS transporter n=1 Tax=Paenarthrobacter sp. NPDC089714 TaxID=3364377 RepID=UPI003803CB4F